MDWNQLLLDRPDVQAEAERLRSTADQNSPWAAQHAVASHNTNQDFAQWWFNNYGQNEGYNQNPVAPPPAPVAPEPTAPVAPPPTGTPDNTGVGLSPNAADINGSQTRESALAQALARAKLDVFSRGLDWGSYESQITPFYNDIYNSIDPKDKNPGSYFDPNMAGSILGGIESRGRAGAMSQAATLSGGGNRTMLDATIQRLLTDGSNNATQALDRGLKRGQLNDIGYQGGMSKLQQAKEKAKAKLSGAANDIFSSYDSKFNEISNAARGAAAGYSLGGGFDISPYQKQYDNLRNTMLSSAEGELMSSVDYNNLFDIGELRGAAGEAQGTQNLKNLDVLEALSKRKKANEVGNGLGSQGAF